MPALEINGAQIYYETYGEDRPGEAPLLLIHGSSVTGQEDWGMLAPLLARSRRVIVPDCRGHGRSSNPNQTYSFKEMAGDLAALVGALGYERAHVLGHSNGGNVALVMLMEHPDVVQTAILQAANAYVSQDLIDRLPPKYEPERVLREAPEWKEQLDRSHGAVHGPEYWRSLLRLTLEETIREPNYTLEQLGKVDQPVLVIEGASDPTNAPAQHAQFMARHIKFAELWNPTGAGHNVHLDLPLEWLRRVEAFLAARGDTVSEALYRLKQQRFADEREGMFEVKAQRQGEKISLAGRVLTEAQAQAAVEAVTNASGEAEPETGLLKVLLTHSTPWALVNRPVTDVRREPRSLAERVSQAIMGESVRVLEEADVWTQVRMERDGYIGWVRTAALHPCSFEEVQAYHAASRWRVQDELLPATAGPEDDMYLDGIVGRLVFGTAVPIESEEAGQVEIRLPDGRIWWASKEGVIACGNAPRVNDPAGVAEALNLIKRFIGIPYLWGGRTPYGYDCSGLAGMFYQFMGVPIPRDADIQYRDGQPVSGEAQPGDLLFFGELNDKDGDDRFGAITHVAISLGGSEVIHANSGAGGISVNSLQPDSPIYRGWLRDNLIGIRRFS